MTLSCQIYSAKLLLLFAYIHGRSDIIFNGKTVYTKQNMARQVHFHIYFQILEVFESRWKMFNCMRVSALHSTQGHASRQLRKIQNVPKFKCTPHM